MSWWAWAEGVSNGSHVPPDESVPEVGETDTQSDAGPADAESASLVHRDLAHYWRDRRSS